MIFYHVIFYHDILSYDILSYISKRFIFQRNLKKNFSGDWRAALKVNNGG